MEEVVGDDAIITTNTSSLTVTDLAASLKHPRRFAGMHFFNPVEKMPLVEVVSGEKTSDATIALIIGLVKKMGKIPVHVKDCHGFLVNRVLLYYLNEAGTLLDEGVPIERIDRVLIGFGMPMGAFLLLDEIGIDIGVKVAAIMEKAYAPRFVASDALKRAGENGKALGRKTGKGFYIHEGKRRVNPAMRRLLATQASRSRKPHGDNDILYRCMCMFLGELVRVMDEGIITDAGYIDLAFVTGAGFPAFRGGPLKWADTTGIPHLVEIFEGLASRYGEKYIPPERLKRMAEEGRTFHSGEKSDE